MHSKNQLTKLEGAQYLSLIVILVRIAITIQLGIVNPQAYENRILNVD